MSEIDKRIDGQDHDGLPDLAPEPGLEHEPQMEPKQDQDVQEHLPEQTLATQDALEAGGGERWQGWPGESVFRMLVPAQKVGGIIGRKGEFIKKMCEEAKARIKILDGPSGIAERAVLVSAKEEPDLPLPPAIDGLLKVHRRVVDGLENDSTHSPRTANAKVSTKLLVPAAQAGSLIGKQGSTVKSIQEASNCIVRVLGAEDLPVFALPDDRVVEVVGEPSGVHTAIELIASHLRRFLVDRSIIPVFEQQMQMIKPPLDHLSLPPWGPPPPPLPHHQSYHPNPGYGSSHFMPPPRQRDNYYPPPADMERAPPPHQGISAYGRDAPMAAYTAPPSNTQSGSSVVTQITQQMQIPLSYADAVIGTNGASISYIRRVSGATVTIQEARGIPGEMTVEINGTASQVQTAQQLIQNFMADAAAAPAPSQAAPPPPQPADQGYSAAGYAAPAGSMYPPAAPQSTGVSGQTGGGYASVYGASYGY